MSAQRNWQCSRCHTRTVLTATGRVTCRSCDGELNAGALSELAVLSGAGKNWRILRQIEQRPGGYLYLAEDEGGTLHHLRERMLAGGTAHYLRERACMAAYSRGIPGLPALTAAWSDERRAYGYIAFEYVPELISLETLFADKYQLSSRLLRRFVRQMLSIMHHLHTRRPAVAYLHLHPGQVFVDWRGGGQLWLRDFSWATQMIAGAVPPRWPDRKAPWLAPERKNGNGKPPPVDTHADIYELGHLFTLMAHKTKGDTAIPGDYWFVRYADGFASDLLVASARAVRGVPADRFPTVADFYRAVFEKTDER